MKMIHTLRNLLFAGITSLCIASCGGGGGGGGGSDAGSDDSTVSDSGSGSTTSSQTWAPDRLWEGQIFNATISGKTYNLPILSATVSGNATTGTVQYDGKNRAFRYEKTGNTTATFRWCVETQTSPGLAGTGVTSAPMVVATNWECECNFTAKNSGNIPKVRLAMMGNYSNLDIAPVLPGKTGTFKIIGNAQTSSDTE